MINGDFEIDGNLYGKRQGVFVRNVGLGGSEWRTQDAVNPAGDDKYFGRDYLTPGSWTLNLGTNGRSRSEDLAALASVARVWNKPLRRPGAESVLKYCIDGRVRRLYGRCRGVIPEVNQAFLTGYVPATATFDTRDPLVYDDTERSSGRITLLPAPSGGVLLPATLPFTLSKAVPRSGLVDVGGDAETPVRIIGHGPLTGKWAVTVGGRRVEMNHTLAYDRSVLIDTRTMTVIDDTGANLAGKLSRKVFLPDVRLAPGPSEVIFEGNDDSGTSWAEVLFHDANYGF